MTAAFQGSLLDGPDLETGGADESAGEGARLRIDEGARPRTDEGARGCPGGRRRQ